MSHLSTTSARDEMTLELLAADAHYAAQQIDAEEYDQWLSAVGRATVTEAEIALAYEELHAFENVEPAPECESLADFLAGLVLRQLNDRFHVKTA